MTPNVGVAYIIAFLLGLGDAAVNTLLIAMLGRVYSGGDTDVFALYYFFKSAFAGIAFAYAGSFSLTAQLVILVVLLLLGTWSYIILNEGVKAEAAGAKAAYAKLSGVEHGDVSLTADGAHN